MCPILPPYSIVFISISINLFMYILVQSKIMLFDRSVPSNVKGINSSNFARLLQFERIFLSSWYKSNCIIENFILCEGRRHSFNIIDVNPCVWYTASHYTYAASLMVSDNVLHFPPDFPRTLCSSSIILAHIALQQPIRRLSWDSGLHCMASYGIELASFLKVWTIDCRYCFLMNRSTDIWSINRRNSFIWVCFSPLTIISKTDALFRYLNGYPVSLPWEVCRSQGFLFE